MKPNDKPTRQKLKHLSAEQLFVYSMRMLQFGRGFAIAPILQFLRTGPLPHFEIPRHEFKRPRVHLHKRKTRGAFHANFRQLQGRRYANPALMAHHRALKARTGSRISVHSAT